MENQISEEFFRWIKSGQSGCIFARILTHQKFEPWESVVFYGETFDNSLPARLDKMAKDALGTAEAIQFLFPEIKTPAKIAELIRNLCTHPRWHCKEILPKRGERTPSLLVGVRWDLPDDKNVNWVLGFADLETMPLTRRAPVTAFLLRLGPPGPAPGIARKNANEIPMRKRESGHCPVHLADLPLSMPDEAIVKTWDATEINIKHLLGEETEARASAHAKVTFSLTPEVRTILETSFRPDN